MKKIFLLLVIICSLQAKGQNNNYLSVAIGKTTSAYRYFEKFSGQLYLSTEYNHYLNKHFSATINTNFGNLKNPYDTKAWFINSAAGIKYTFNLFKRTKMAYNFAIGYELLNIKPVLTSKIILHGITYINALTIIYSINENIGINLGYKIQQSDMWKNEEFSKLNFFHRTRFGALTLGISVTIKHPENEN